jgi:hypothetical protein
LSVVKRQLPEVGAEAQFLSSVYGGDVHGLYSDALKGYSVAMLPEQAEALSLDERVQFVEEDSVVLSQIRRRTQAGT